MANAATALREQGATVAVLCKVQSQAMPSGTDRREESVAFALEGQEVERFRHDGFLALDCLMPPDEVLEVRQALERLFKSRVGYEEGSRFDFLSAEDDPDKPVMPQILRPSLYAPELLRGVAARRAAVIARQLIGSQARLSFDHVLMKPAFSSAGTPWHQDDAFADPGFESQSVSIWIPLQAVSQTNGCLCFIQGSATRAILPHRSPGDDGRIHGLECISGFEDAGGVPYPIPAGGCTIHGGRTLHGAGPNLSDAPRYALVMVFSTPKRPVAVVEPRPWLAHKQTARSQRERGWRWRGGWIIHVRRRFPHICARAYHRLVHGIGRRAS